MENFEKCTIAMLGGLCMQHVTGNTSRLNQTQSAIMCQYNPVAELPTVPEFPGHVTGRVEKLRNTDHTSNITEITSFVEIYSWMLISHIRLIFSSVSAPKLTFNM